MSQSFHNLQVSYIVFSLAETITGSRSNIEDSREDIFSQSSSVVVMTDLPTQTGERNMAAISDV